MAFVASPYVNKVHKNKRRISNTGARALDDDDAECEALRMHVHTTRARRSQVWFLV